MVDYSDRLVWAMEEANCDIKQLADALGASYQAVKKVVDGKSSAFSAINNAKAARALRVDSDWLALGEGGPDEGLGSTFISAQQADPTPEGYIRLDRLPYEPSMGGGRMQTHEHIIQHVDVLESFVRQKIGTVNPDRIKLLTGVGTSMEPTISDQDVVFVDIEKRWIDAPGIYVIDVGGLLLLKKALILSSGVLILRSENTSEYPDEERFDLSRVGDSITICGKVMAWWSLKKG